MLSEFQSIDEAINASYQSASQVETMARQLEARIPKLMVRCHLPHRTYGQPVDLENRSNSTLTSLHKILLSCALLCIDPSIRHRIDEKFEARAMAVSLQMAPRPSEPRTRPLVRSAKPGQLSPAGSAVTELLNMLARPPRLRHWCYCQPGDSQRLRSPAQLP